MTPEAMYIAAAALPIVAGIHRYAVNYGYRGQSRYEAFDDAWKVSSMVGLLCWIGLVAHLCLYGW